MNSRLLWILHRQLLWILLWEFLCMFIFSLWTFAFDGATANDSASLCSVLQVDGHTIRDSYLFGFDFYTLSNLIVRVLPCVTSIMVCVQCIPIQIIFRHLTLNLLVATHGKRSSKRRTITKSFRDRIRFSGTTFLNVRCRRHAARLPVSLFS
jgi:hypothetical protein